MLFRKHFYVQQHINLNDLLSTMQIRLFRTAKNIIIDNARRMSKCPEPEEEAFNEDDYSSVTVQMMCRQLPENERTLFHLRYFEGYNATELGEMFDMPSATIRSKLASARAKLRKMLNEVKGV